MEVLEIPVEALRARPTNSRKHSAEQVAQIAASIQEFGFTNPVLVDEHCEIIAGHGRLEGARLSGMESVPCIVLDKLTDAQKRAYVIADNQLALNAGWDVDILRDEIELLKVDGFELDLVGFDPDFLDTLFDDVLPPEEVPAPAPAPEVDGLAVSKPGDVWQLGPHRVMCGDSLNVDDVHKLTGGAVCDLLHADPPYGMDKKTVENDQLKGDKLDAFQMDWWALWRTFTRDTGSAYIWGNAPDLWRLWFGRLKDTETLELRNELVWDKETIPGMKSDLMTQYPVASERCLFIQFGDQLLNNVNSWDYWDGWDVCRVYLAEQAEAVGLTPAKCREVTGVQMYSHWFSKSQWSLIPVKHYDALAQALPGYFSKPHNELRKDHDRARVRYKDHLDERRAYFDNAHDVMTDVWKFPRVVGDDREGHDTPKPVALMERVVKSSCPKEGLTFEPFGGSGSTLIAAERTDRTCYTMELTPRFVDVIVRRWQKYTGQSAAHAETGAPFGE